MGQRKCTGGSLEATNSTHFCTVEACKKELLNQPQASENPFEIAVNTTDALYAEL